MAEALQTLPLRGFDPGGEPSIRVMSDGSLEIWFTFMPPSDTEFEDGLGEFAGFDQEMSTAVGVPVIWEDREFLRIEDAPPGTVDRVRKFVEGYRHRR